MSDIQLCDLIKVDLCTNNQDVKNLCDNAKNSGRKLEITFALSHSCKRINDRIYSIKGQKDGISTWTTPYRKPILLYHEGNTDPIGRFKSVEYVSLEKEAASFFPDRQSFQKFKALADSNNAKGLYKAMKKYGLLDRKDWPGMGMLVAKADIVDSDAIQKFIDERYMTFSAGSYTNSFVCGKCGSDWAKGDVCEHAPGSSDEDGPAIFFTDFFGGREGSVVSTPADDTGIVLSMQFVDSADNSSNIFKINTQDVIIADANITIGDDMNIEDIIKGLVDMGARNIVRKLYDGSLSDEQKDALNATSHFEINFLIRIHDALHYEYDWQVKYNEESQIPDAIFILHYELMKLSVEKSFRDSIINGALDGYDKDGKESTEYVNERIKSTEDSIIDAINELKDMFKSTSFELATIEVESLSDQIKKLFTDKEFLNSITKLIEVNELKVFDVNTDDIDWQLLNMALQTKLGDNKEDELNLSDAQYCGSDKVFPIANAKYAEIAHELINSAKLTNDQKERANQCIDYAASFSKKLQDDSIFEDLQRDYQEALELVTQLKEENKNLNDRILILDKDNTFAENNSQSVLDPGSVKKVEDASVSSTPALKGNEISLSNFEQQIIKKYKEIKDSAGAEQADVFIKDRKLKGIIARSFDVTKHLGD